MKKLFILPLFIFIPCFANQTLTRELLLKNSPVPDKREFPESKTIKPCEDFHAYVCSEVEKSFKMPEDRSYWNFAFVDNSERLLTAKKNYFKLIENGYEPVTDRAKPMKNFFMACMNEKASQTDEKFVVETEKERLLKVASHKELIDLSASRMDQAEFTLVNFDTIANSKDSSRLDALFMSKIMSLPERSYYEKKDLIQDYQKLLTLFFTTLKVDDAEKRAGWVIDFEREVANRFPLPAEFRHRFSTDTSIKRKDLLKKYPNLNLEVILKRVPERVVLRDLSPETLIWLNATLQKLPLEQLKSVYLFHALESYMDDGYPEYFNASFEFNKKFLGGEAVRPPRQERCTKQVMKRYNRELDQELIPVLFPKIDEAAMVETAESVRKNLLASLEKNTWLSKKAKKEAINKIKVASLYLVKPKNDVEWYFNPTLTFASDKPIQNSKTFQKAMIERDIRELSEPRLKNRWGTAPLNVNAYYSPSDNKFVLLLGILQPPMFDSNATLVENLAAIGSVVGHELGHAVDDNGSKYDSKGSLRQWMSKKDLEMFKKLTEPLVTQFNAAGHDGKLTLGENIGDLVGVTTAYSTAFEGKANVPQSDKRKFFVAYAKNWCSVIRPDLEKRFIKTDPHAMGYARINQQVVHQNGFYEAFDCKAGDKMYLAPEARVRVW